MPHGLKFRAAKLLGSVCSRVALIVGLVLALGIAAAQPPLAGKFLEHQIGLLLDFEVAPFGHLTGYLVGDSGQIPLSMEASDRSMVGSFVLEGETVGISAELQQDDTTLHIYLFSLDQFGQPLPNSYELYYATRTSAPASVAVQPPSVATPAAPGSPTGAPPTAGSSAPDALTNPFAPPPEAQRATPLRPEELAGSWKGVVTVQGLILEFRFDVGPGNTYRHELYVDGQSVMYEAGSYALGEGGRLSVMPSEGSDEVCMGGECSAVEQLGDTNYTASLMEDGLLLVLTDVDALPEDPLAQIAYRKQLTASADRAPAEPAPQGTPLATSPAFTATAVTNASQLTGSWELTQSDGTRTLLFATSFDTDGTYKQTATLDGVLAARTMGTYSLVEEGALTLMPLSKECFSGEFECVSYEPVRFGVFLYGEELALRSTDGALGEEEELVLQRAR